MKTSELSGFELDWAVAKAEGEKAELNHGEVVTWKTIGYHEYRLVWRPSTDWAQAGPIIERERIHLTAYNERWGAYAWPNHTGEPWPTDYEERVKRSKGKPASEMLCRFGQTPLIAAMRCYVASKLGDEIEIPEELNQEQTT